MVEDGVSAVAVEYSLPAAFRVPLGADLRAKLLSAMGAGASREAAILPPAPFGTVLSRFARRFLCGDAGMVKPADPLALFIFDARIMRWPDGVNGEAAGADAAESSEVVQALRVEHVFDVIQVGC